MGRTLKLNNDLIKKIGETLKEGLPLTSTCDLHGITTMSISNWMKLGEADYNNDVDSLFASLFYTIKKSKAEYELTACRKINSGAIGWQGTAWWLERTHQQYMPKQEIVADEGRVQVVLGGKIKEVKKSR